MPQIGEWIKEEQADGLFFLLEVTEKPTEFSIPVKQVYYDLLKSEAETLCNKHNATELKGNETTMGYNANDYVSAGSFLRAADLEALGLPAAQVTILCVEPQTFPANDMGPEETKLVLTFDELDKILPLNKTNTRIMIDCFGPDTDGWLQKAIILNVTTVNTKNGPVKSLGLSAVPVAVVPIRPTPTTAQSPKRPAPVAPVGAVAGDPFHNE